MKGFSEVCYVVQRYTCIQACSHSVMGYARRWYKYTKDAPFLSSAARIRWAKLRAEGVIVPWIASTLGNLWKSARGTAPGRGTGPLCMGFVGGRCKDV